MASSELPSSHASDGSDDSDSDSSSSSAASSHASDHSSDSSSASLPSSTVQVASVDELLHTLYLAEPHVQVKFVLAPDMPLAEVQKLWGLVKAHGGGEAVLTNPDRLGSKDEANRCVNNRIERLRRWKRHLHGKHDKVLDAASKLEGTINAGGPGVRPGYQPHRYDGLPAFVDVEQVVEKKEMKQHVEAIRTALLQGSPCSPATNGGPGSVEACNDLEAKEQLDIAQFNLAYLELKSSGLELLTDHLEGGIAKLEERFVTKPTHLGAGDADFVRFVDVPMYPNEPPPPSHY